MALDLNLNIDRNIQADTRYQLSVKVAVLTLAIRSLCRDICQAGNREDVETCGMNECPLYPYRRGTNSRFYRK